MALQVVEQLKPLTDLIEPQNELPSFLIKPVQRICKYPLLLKELVKFTEDRHVEMKQELEEAYESMNRVTSMINELRRKEENRKTVTELEKAVENWKVLFLPYLPVLFLYRASTCPTLVSSFWIRFS